jgi:hypothetical protein
VHSQQTLRLSVCKCPLAISPLARAVAPEGPIALLHKSSSLIGTRRSIALPKAPPPSAPSPMPATTMFVSAHPPVKTTVSQHKQDLTALPLRASTKAVRAAGSIVLRVRLIEVRALFDLSICEKAIIPFEPMLLSCILRCCRAVFCFNASAEENVSVQIRAGLVD